MLLPAAIFRQVLFDPTEFTPAWLRSRPAPAPGAARPSDSMVDETTVGASVAIDEPKPAKRPGRSKTTDSAGPKRTRSKRIGDLDRGGAAH